MTTEQTCEACRTRPVEVHVADDGAQEPYRTCSACARRLRACALRPLEWFNLAAIHGPTRYLLHDDFYWYNGVAQQPDEDVEEPERFAAPTLESARNDLERLLDYAMSLWFLDAETAAALRQHPKEGVLLALIPRVEAHRNIDIEARAYDICEQVLGTAAAEWIRGEWDNWRPDTFYALCAATAACLPLDEGFRLVTEVLESDPSRERLANDGLQGTLLGFALAPFRSRRTLGWMEAHPELLVSHEDWGRAAALSHFSWRKAQEWIERGRPLSHIALFAILACVRYDTKLLQEQRPILEEPPSTEEMLSALEAFHDADHVPRVRQLVERIRQGL